MTSPSGNGPATRLQVFGATDVGRRRSENQDSFLVAELVPGTPDAGVRIDSTDRDGELAGGAAFELGPGGALVFVADGMGGPAGGALASAMAVEAVREAMLDRWTADSGADPARFARRLAEGIEEASRRIHARTSGRPDLAGMGTTATAVGFLDGHAYLGQVGDSRAYLYRRGEAVQLTRDQSLVWEMVEAGTMSEAEAETSSQRNILVQAVGTEPEVNVDVTYQPLRRGDVIVVCSDGLSGPVSRQDLAEVLRSEPDPEAACRTLIDLANERGGPDNITVVVARVDGDGLEPPSPDDPAGRRRFDPEAR